MAWPFTATQYTVGPTPCGQADGCADLVFHVFLMVINFIAERNARQLFELREQLKLQYKATQRAQMMEKKASDLTKRFVSYSGSYSRNLCQC